MTTRIQLRRDTAARWASVNPVLAAGEPAVESDTGKLKVGDGITAWSSLPYILDVADLTPVIESMISGIVIPPGMSDENVRDIVGTIVVGDGDYITVDADDVDNVVRVLPGAAITEGLSDLEAALGTKVNSSTYVAGLADKQDAATLGEDVAADPTVQATYATYLTLAANPDTIIVGTITRDSNGAATSAPVVWPDGSPGTYTADTVSSAFPGAVDAYHVTYGSPVTRTYTQAAVTRDATGAVTQRPALTVS